MEIDTSRKIYGITNTIKKEEFYGFLIAGIISFLLMLILAILFSGKIMDIIVGGVSGMFIALMWIVLALKNCRHVIVDSTGITITFNYFKSRTIHYTWQDYECVTLSVVRNRVNMPYCRIVCTKTKREKKEWIFSGTVSVQYTPENYDLISEWGRKDKYMAKPNEEFLKWYSERDEYETGRRGF